MRIQAIILSAFIGLAGCSTSTDDLKAKSGTVTGERVYEGNYQTVYRNLFTTATNCLGVDSVRGSLYSELGMGEITHVLSGPLVSDSYYWKAEIEKTSDGAKMTAWSGNTVVNDKSLRQLFSWAEGDKECNTWKF